MVGSELREPARIQALAEDRKLLSPQGSSQCNQSMLSPGEEGGEQAPGRVARGVLPGMGLTARFSGRKKNLFVIFADFHGINPPAIVNFKLPKSSQ